MESLKVGGGQIICGETSSYSVTAIVSTILVIGKTVRVVALSSISPSNSA